MDASELQAGLEAVLSEPLGGPTEVHDLRRLSGGASRETWSFDATALGDAHELILRRDPPGAAKGGMGLEGRLLAAAATAGVPVPRVLVASDDRAVLGTSFLVMDRLAGETIARKILRDDAYAGARPLLAAQCGAALAKLHAVDPGTVDGLAATDELEQWAGVLEQLSQPHPALELGLRWLRTHRPAPTRQVVVHGDFRNGNLIVGPEGLRAVLDWELAHRGDAMEDLGWLCVRAWRFGEDTKPAGGFGSYDDLVEAYEAAGGAPVDRAALHWWETLGTFKWGVMCILQASAHLSGAVRSVELAAIGRRVCENEWDLLACLDRAQAGMGGVAA